MITLNKITGPDGLSIWIVGVSIDINFTASMVYNDWEIFDNELSAWLYIDMVTIC